MAIIDIRKMRTEYGDPVRYYTESSDGEINMNELIGKSVTLSFEGVVHPGPRSPSLRGSEPPALP